MAKLPNRKRGFEDEADLDGGAAMRNGAHANEPSQPAKKVVKTRSETELEAWRSWKYPPDFWDGLSRIELTPLALEELNRQTRTRPPHPSALATHGGLDLRDLIGYPYQTAGDQHPASMSASRSSQSRNDRPTDQTSALSTKATVKSKESTPYDRNFDLHLTEHAIHPTWKSGKPNVEEIKAALGVPRPSFSTSMFSEGAFERFQEWNDQAKDEDDVLANVIPTLLGASQADHHSARNTVFGNLEPLTDGTLAAPKPDIHYGAHPKQLARSARDELAGHIIPSTMQGNPVAPNFFLEVKGPDGSAAVATRQVRYDGAIGSRAMHSLQNYGVEEPQYDGQAYTYSSTYHAGTGTLQLYSHHLTAPEISGGRPEYHTTQLDSWGMTGNANTFRRGATAFRNARDLAKRNRDRFIRDANARAFRAQTVAAEGLAQAVYEPSADSTAWRDADEALQQDIADNTDAPEW